MSARNPSRPDTVKEIDALLWELAQRYRREVLDAYKWYDLVGADVPLVEALAQGADTPSALARTLGCAAPHVTIILDRLEARTLTERTQNPHDARSMQVTLTPAGMKLVATVREKRQSRLEAILAGFPAKERERLQRYLVRLKDGIMTSDKTAKGT